MIPHSSFACCSDVRIRPSLAAACHTVPTSAFILLLQLAILGQWPLICAKNTARAASSYLRIDHSTSDASAFHRLHSSFPCHYNTVPTSAFILLLQQLAILSPRPHSFFACIQWVELAMGVIPSFAVQHTDHESLLFSVSACVLHCKVG